jgi:hypothetical protein
MFGAALSKIVPNKAEQPSNVLRELFPSERRRPGFGLLSFSGPVVLRLKQSSEREYRSELLSPIVRLSHVPALKEFAVSGGRARNDVAGFIDERHP